jgi:hypothetical protein
VQDAVDETAVRTFGEGVRHGVPLERKSPRHLFQGSGHNCGDDVNDLLHV